MSRPYESSQLCHHQARTSVFPCPSPANRQGSQHHPEYHHTPPTTTTTGNEHISPGYTNSLLSSPGCSYLPHWINTLSHLSSAVVGSNITLGRHHQPGTRVFTPQPMALRSTQGHSKSIPLAVHSLTRRFTGRDSTGQRLSSDRSSWVFSEAYAGSWSPICVMRHRGSDRGSVFVPTE